MTKRIVLAGLILIAIVASIGIHFYSQEAPLATSHIKLEFIPFTNAEGVIFMLAPTTEGIVFSGLGYVDLPLTATASASGARYENSQLKLVVWNKGEELSVYQGDDLVFTGIKGTTPPVIPIETEATSSAPLEALTLLTSYTWQWEEEGPKWDISEDNPFTLLYQADGTLIGGTDCNNFRARYNIATTTSVLTHFDIISTKMACLDSKESAYLENLSAVTSFYFSEGLNLILKTSDGTVLYFAPQLIPML